MKIFVRISGINMTFNFAYAETLYFENDTFL